jgi:hypothetical protein
MIPRFFKPGAVVLLVFVTVAGALLAVREPFIDESWYTGPAVSFIEEGRFLDLGSLMWRSEAARAYGLEMTAFVLSLWYRLGGVDIFWGRILSLLAAVVFLLLLNRYLKDEIPSEVIRNLVVLTCATNYFFLKSATQIRPEIFALACTLGGMLSFRRWAADPARSLSLVVAHLLLIAASLFHLQAAFAGLVLWVAFPLFVRRTHAARSLAGMLLPYMVAALVLGFLLWPQRELVMEKVNFIFRGDWGGHRGGMVAAVARYWVTRDYAKLIVAVGMLLGIGTGMAAAAVEGRGVSRRILTMFGAGTYLSWVLTTGHIDALHAVWLVIPLAGMTSGGWSMVMRRGAWATLVGASLICLGALLSLVGLRYALGEVRSNPYRHRYLHDMREFDRNHAIGVETVYAPREVLWYFNHRSANLSYARHGGSPRYFITRSRQPKVSLFGHDYELILAGREFNLRRLVAETGPSRAEGTAPPPPDVPGSIGAGVK